MDKARDTLTKTFNSVKDKWLGIAAKTRIIILAVVGVILVSAFIITRILNAPSDVVLTKTSGPDEAGEILNVLATADIVDTRIDSDSTVYVTDKDYRAARIAISEAGLPRAGFNNDTWNNGISMFTTDKQANEIIKHQLQDNIMSFLSDIPEVERSKVILHIPQTQNYVMVENKEEARASVSVQLKAGQTLSSTQIKGIHHFVLTSVPGLEEHNITVTDGSGIQLIPDDITVSDGDKLALEQQKLTFQASIIALMSDNAEERLNPLMAAAFGEDGFYVAVNAEVDFSEGREVIDEVFTPVVGLDSGIVRRIEQKAAAGGVALEGGPIGTFIDADIGPDYPTIPEIQAGDEFYVDWGHITEYEINRRLETYQDTGLRIKNKTASVVVNSEPMTPAEIETWEGIVANATGASEVQVVARVFPLPPSEIEPNPGGFGSMTRNILIYVIIALGVLLVILFVLAITTSGSRRKRFIRNRGIPLPAEGTGGYLTEDSFQPLGGQDDSFELQSLLEENETKDVVLKREIKEFSKSNPEIIAQLIRTWLREDDI